SNVPLVRYRLSAGVYDSLTDRLVTFGGYASRGVSVQTNEVWTLGLAGGTGWKRQLPVSPPAARAGHGMVLDARRRRISPVGAGVGRGGSPRALALPSADEWSRLPPLARLAPSQLDLPVATVGDTIRTSVRISNLGIQPLHVSGIGATSPEFAAPL